jgi:glutamate synthase domain-containing protein 2/glutamate synthase domain-containing protein 1/glutamate synthase domain-containing protein 3
MRETTRLNERPDPVVHGLYDENFEHDACGVGFIADLNGNRTHDIVSKGIEILVNLEHRGASGAEKNTGDGAGILTQLPHAFFLKMGPKAGIKVPAPGQYGVGQVFLPKDPKAQKRAKDILERCIDECGQNLLGWREVPVDPAGIGPTALSGEPSIWQVFVGRSSEVKDPESFERKLYVIRKYAERSVREEGFEGSWDFYVCSLSYKTLLYKGMLTPPQVGSYFVDLADEAFQSAIALVHSRFSTNTMPTWPLAHPFRTLAHNGEINTLRGNRNWMTAREGSLRSDLFSDDEIKKILPVVEAHGSDSATLDNVVELLVMGGRSIPHVMMMLIPEAWEKDPEMTPEKKAFYEYHGALIEPWDGPASVAFTDGHLIGATLDRNGLRPSRYMLTKDNILVMASEAGVLEFPPEDVVLKGRLQPGRMFIASLDEHRIIPDEEIKHRICGRKPYGEWLGNKIVVSELPAPREIRQPSSENVIDRQKAFGYTLEDLRFLMEPMARNGEEAIGSMGTDVPLAVLSDKSQVLFNYFKQLFAQVTNPPIDPIREETVMSLTSYVGGEGNLLQENEGHARIIELTQPILTNDELERLRWVDKNGFTAKTISIVFKATEGEGRLKKALDRIRRQAVDAIDEGYEVIILSDKPVDSGHAAIPSLLAVGAVHHHLIRLGLRSKVGLIVETGESREVHHFALLLGYGASAVNPWLAFQTIEDMRRRKLLPEELTQQKAEYHYIKAVGKGLLKIMSKMGISAIPSYIGAQIFEAVGLGQELVEEYFTGTPSRVGGIELDTLEKETLLRHRFAFPEAHVEDYDDDIEVGGQYQWRQRGERHMLNPDTIHKLQQATWKNDWKVFKEYTRLIDDQATAPITLRGLLDFTSGTAVPLEEVESVETIVRRFASGAMSFGSISWEAHTTIAIAMNRLGGKSNTGEGGEDSRRFKTVEKASRVSDIVGEDALANYDLKAGDSLRSAIKQVASGRFGVTSNYLVNADELQIKMAQGAKPGEGGQLPGHKVDKWIGATRHSTPGVGLISPPPHHDIYSIEDLAQLIYDLKNANTRARISVKLVAEVGVGTVAAGVAKAHSDVILISGHDGGTGASPQTSIKHAGLPWELGLAEAHQVLVRNGLRDRVVLQTDGMLRTGRDIAIAAMLGAEEWGVATAALVVMGCIMMRKCHLNTCPVGVATQDPELRKEFKGRPEHVETFFRFLAQDLREQMAALGFRTVDEMVGRADRLAPRKGITHWKARTLKLENLLHRLDVGSHGQFCCTAQDHGLDTALDNELLKMAASTLRDKSPMQAEIRLRNVNRTVGTILSSEITRRFGPDALPEDTVRIKATGTAGQSFMAFGVQGVTMEIEGEANDYFGKGLSGGKLILYPPKASTFDPVDNVIVGNVSFYGATSGEAYIMGKAGERFCVRNSGAKVVVESVGDHGCEYMTGGRVVILGDIGRNFAAGMSGGVAYLLENDKTRSRVNPAMVALEEVVDAEDLIELKELIERHAEYTGSKRALDLLARWPEAAKSFVKVMPVDYKRALREQAAAVAAVGGRS